MRVEDGRSMPVWHNRRGPQRARFWRIGVEVPGSPTRAVLAHWGGSAGVPNARGFGAVEWRAPGCAVYLHLHRRGRRCHMIHRDNSASLLRFLTEKLIRRVIVQETRMKVRTGLAPLVALLVVVGTAAAQDSKAKAWQILEGGAAAQGADERAIAVRVLGLLTGDKHAIELAEKALQDLDADVRAAGHTA